MKCVLCVQVRSTISDFAVFLTIMIMVLVDYLVGVPSPKLNVPDRFEVMFHLVWCKPSQYWTGLATKYCILFLNTLLEDNFHEMRL